MPLRVIDLVKQGHRAQREQILDEELIANTPSGIVTDYEWMSPCTVLLRRRKRRTEAETKGQYELKSSHTILGRAITSPHFPDLLRDKFLEVVVPPRAEEEKRHAALSDTNRQQNNSCRNDDWHGHARSSLAKI